MNIDKIGLQNIFSLLSEKLLSWYESLIKLIPNLVAAIITFLFFIVLAKLTRKTSGNILPRISDNRAVNELLKTISGSFVLIIGMFVCLEILKLDKTVTSILAGAGVLGLALGFAFQEIASNFVSGTFIAFRKPYKLGDIIKINDFFGEVTDINLRTSSITTFQGLEVIIPNKDMFTMPFINFTTTPIRRLDIEVGVSYGDDLEKVTEVTKNALEKIPERASEHPIEVYFKEFANSSINLTARVWIKYPKNQAFLKARHKAIIEIKKAYDTNDITIPFPIRTLDFGIKGGKPLREMIDKN